MKYLLPICLLLVGCGFEKGTVTVKNEGQNMLDSLRVEVVDDRIYQMGDLPPGETRSVAVGIVGRLTVHLYHGERERLQTSSLPHRFSGDYIVTVTSDSTGSRVLSSQMVAN